MRFSSLGFGVIAGLVFTGSASAGTVFDYGMLFEGLSVPGTTTGFQPDGSAFTLSGSLYDFSNAGTATSGDFESAFVSHVWSQAAITLTATAFDSTGTRNWIRREAIVPTLWLSTNRFSAYPVAGSSPVRLASEKP